MNIRILFVVGTLTAVKGAHLRQTVGPDVLQPVELSIQLLSQAVETITESLETQLLTMLYPDSAADVQAQLDTCEDNFWRAQGNYLRALNSNLGSIAASCAGGDQTAAINQLIQDTLTVMATYTFQCDDLTVDLIGDLNNFVAAAIVQGYELTAGWSAPAAQLAISVTSPLQFQYDYIGPITRLVDSTFQSLGATVETTTQDAAAARALFDSVNAIFNDFASSGVLSQSDVAIALGAPLALSRADDNIYAELVQNSAQFISPAVQLLCAFAAPLTGLIPN